MTKVSQIIRDNIDIEQNSDVLTDLLKQIKNVFDNRPAPAPAQAPVQKLTTATSSKADPKVSHYASCTGACAAVLRGDLEYNTVPHEFTLLPVTVTRNYKDPTSTSAQKYNEIEDRLPLETQLSFKDLVFKVKELTEGMKGAKGGPLNAIGISGIVYGLLSTADQQHVATSVKLATLTKK